MTDGSPANPGDARLSSSTPKDFGEPSGRQLFVFKSGQRFSATQINTVFDAKNFGEPSGRQILAEPAP